MVATKAGEGCASEEALGFACEGERVFGILHRPLEPKSRAVLIIVGGPQTRVGSHRQFVLLARALAAEGYAALRFDYRGMGDSDGHMRDFEAIDADIASAVEALANAVPQARDIVLWGLCDAASAALFHAPSEPRIKGLVLLNPWVRSEQGLARSYLKRYYLQRLFSPDLWLKIVRGQFDFRASMGSLGVMLRSATGKSETKNADSVPATPADVNPATTAPGSPATEVGGRAHNEKTANENPLNVRMVAGLSGFAGHSLFILSGNDLTAGEFKDAAKGSRRWRRALRSSRVQVQHYPSADHTFSSREWRDQVARWTTDWLASW